MKTTHILEGKTMNLTEIGVLIKRARESKGMTQKSLADKIGTSIQVISNIERGDSIGVSAKMFDRVARALGVKFPMTIPREK